MAQNMLVDQGLANFIKVKGQMQASGSISFSHNYSTLPCGVETAVDRKETIGYDCVSLKLYLQKQIVDWVGAL